MNSILMLIQPTQKTKIMRLRAIILLIIALAGSSLWAAPSIEVKQLTAEYQVDPVGIGTAVPRLSWIMSSTVEAQVQTAYQVLVASSPALLNEKKADLWNSKKVSSGQSVLVEYGGKALSSGTRCWWKVRVWDKNGKAGSWSETAFFETGLLEASDWDGKWITAPESGQAKCPVLRKEFTLKGEPLRARLYITSLGYYEAELNGSRVGDQVLTPGWTSYSHRVQYQTYDVTSMLRAGGNALGATLANGWYKDFRQWWFDDGERPVQNLALKAQLVITYRDGSREIIATDESWKAGSGPVLEATVYDGENYDARKENPGWSKAGFNDSGWANAKRMETWDLETVAPESPPMRTREELSPIEILVTPEGDTVLDMGQNMVGWVRLKVQAPRGTRITLRHTEVLDGDGNFYIENLRGAKQTTSYVCKGTGTETWEPRFTFQGFRYVHVSGIPGGVTKDMITGVVVHSDLEQTGTFSCSDSLINQLQHNIVWGQKGNFVDVPTDCPQRDERLGWTGDAQVFAPTAIFNMNCAGFYTKWLADLALDQHEDGAVPWVIPNVLGRGEAHGWADAATIVPWAVYKYYGDVRILEKQYKSMKAWVDYQAAQAGDNYLWQPRERQFGDWLAFATIRSDYPGATTDKDLLATAYFYHSADLLQRAARVLGYQADEEKYAMLMKDIKKAFAAEFITPNGRLSSNTQTAYVVSLAFDLIPGDLRQSAARRLAGDVNAFGHLTTGFLGTPDLCHVLTEHGYLEEAYMLLFRKEYPSWLYPVTKGATTIWERWDGLKPDGTFQNAGMNSFNHYAYGAIGDWLYKTVAGINPDQPGYKSIVIKPHPGKEMNDVKAWHLTPYGKVASSWSVSSGSLVMKVKIPVNTTATIYVPTTGTKASLNGSEIAATEKVTGPGYDYLVIEKGSGDYRIETEYEIKP